MKEKKVEQVGHALSDLLWKDGWRRKKSKSKTKTVRITPSKRN